jgi:hypothetical protein
MMIAALLLAQVIGSILKSGVSFPLAERRAGRADNGRNAENAFWNAEGAKEP